MITKLLEGLPNQSMQQGAFDAAVGKYMADLPVWGAETNALAVDVNEKQVAASAAATAAAESAVSAAAQVPLATAQANNAGSSAVSAAAQVPLATTQATNAQASATAAEASRIAASKLNLGGKPSAPTVDNQGAALLTGATYYDTALDKWRVWNGAAWADGLSAVAGVESINDVTGPVALKTINGESLLSAGNLELPTPSEVSIGIKRAPVAGGVLASPNGYYAFMTAAAYTLPDFTGVDNFGLASLSNSAAVPATFQTSDGWTLAPGLTANTFKAVAPTSSGTPHGTWAGILQTPPLLGLSAAASATSVLGTVQLSSSLVVVLFLVGANLSVIAFNPLTGVFGAPVQVAKYENFDAHIYADSPTTFVVGFPDASNQSNIRVGSVSALTITLASAVAGLGPYGMLTQLAPGLYVHCSTPATGNATVEAFSVSGLYASKGAVAYVDAAFGVIARIDATRFLFTGVVRSNPTPLYAVVGTVAGNTITFGAGVLASSALLTISINAPIRFLRAMSSGGPFIACAPNSPQAGVDTTGCFYGITVSGTTPTIGAVLSLANTLPAAVKPRTYIYPPATDTTQTLLNYSNNQLLVVLDTGAVRALSITGTTITAGAVFGSGSSRLVRDVLTGANCYRVTDTTVDKITVSGTTISSAYQLASTPTVLASDTLNDKAANYGGTWYAWTLPTMACAITADKWLAISGNNFKFYGPIS